MESGGSANVQYALSREMLSKANVDLQKFALLPFDINMIMNDDKLLCHTWL